MTALLISVFLADRRRRGEFKEYELQKEFEHQEKLRSLDEEHQKTYEADLKKQHEKHDKHEKVHHPGSKDQLEEVWGRLFIFKCLNP